MTENKAAKKWEPVRLAVFSIRISSIDRNLHISLLIVPRYYHKRVISVYHVYDSGVPVLNHYLEKFAGQDVKRKTAAVFVLTALKRPECVFGYYTLCATSIELSLLSAELRKKLPRYPEVPAILIGRLARDLSYPGVGSLLLADALTRCVRVANEIGASVVVVDSKGESASRFYKKFGFLSLPKRPNRMFLPMQSAEKL